MLPCVAIDSQPLTQYIIVRADLPLGVAAAQIAHAAGSGSERHPEDTFVVILEVQGESELRRIARKLRSAGIPFSCVVESDAPYTGQTMALGCELTRERLAVRRVVSSLPLYGKARAVESAA